ncbi:MAG: archaemetzincin family Zn-dependent metalloprotease [Bacteroidales bacterium]
MNTGTITIYSFGPFEPAFLSRVAETVASEFRLPVSIKEGYLDLSDFFDPGRRQYEGNRLLKIIQERYAERSLKTIGLFNVDLFIPILTYIFGQAFLNGSTGIASVYRLSNERYGLKKDDELLLERCKKEVIHELGHTFGLIHCHIPYCVMESSTYVEEIDQKGTAFCPKCAEKLFPGGP